MRSNRHTHTVATLEVSERAYGEIADLLRKAGYYHAFLANGVIDMTGIGLVGAHDPKPPAACPNCGRKRPLLHVGVRAGNWGAGDEHIWLCSGCAP